MTTPMPGSLQRLPQGSSLVNAVDPNAIVDVTLVLDAPHPNQAQFVENAMLPASERNFLGSSDLQYSAAAMAAIQNFAAEYGISIKQADPDQNTVHLVGTAANMQRAFATRLNLYRSASGEVFRGREGTLSLPAAVLPYVKAVLGLTTMANARPN